MTTSRARLTIDDIRRTVAKLPERPARDMAVIHPAWAADLPYDDHDLYDIRVLERLGGPLIPLAEWKRSQHGKT